MIISPSPDPRRDDLLRANLAILQAKPKAAEALPVESPIQKLGVLLVHGIGDQERGRTLTQFGEPLFICLEKWMRYHGGGAELSQVILRGNQRAPAYAIVHLWHGRRAEKAAPGSETAADTESGTTVETQWLLAESNWADAFERPGFKSVAFWSIRVVPWFILTQFTDQLAEDLLLGRWVRALFSFGYLVLTFPLALLIQILVLLLVPMSLLPPLRPVVAPIQRWISGVIGDTFVLLNSRFQFQAMVSKVRQDIAWLSRRCDVVAVLAHSQGAAVAHEAVHQAPELKVARLITFGSAVSRLKALRHVIDNAPGMLTASSLVTLTVLMLAALYLWSLFSTGGSILYAVVGIWSLGVLLAFSAYMMPFTLKGINEQCHENQGFRLNAQTKWDDYYATSDPVPNGSMPAVGLYTRQDREVHNTANVFRDHSSYWRNQDQFGIAVVQTLMGLTGGPFQVPPPLWNADTKRAYRIRLQVCARLAALGLAGLALFQHPFFTHRLSAPLWLQIPLGWLAGFANWIFALGGDAVSLVATKLRFVTAPFEPLQIRLPIDKLSWPAAWGLFAVLWFCLSAGVLRWWEKIDTEDCYRSQRTWRSPYPKRTWWVVFSALALVWLGFWISWLIVNPVDFWSQLSQRFKWLDKASGKGWIVWVGVSVYHMINAIRETLQTGRKLRESVPVPSPWKRLAQDLGSFVDRLRHSVRSLGKRQQFRGGILITMLSALTAMAALAVVLLNLKGQGLVQSATGLVALSFGVLGWVRGQNKLVRSFAAFGMVIGVLAMPTIAAVHVGFEGAAAAGLIALGIVAAGCAWAGAESLRRGWAGLKQESNG